MRRMVTAFFVVSLVAAVLTLPISAHAWGRGPQHFHHFHRFHRCCFFGGFAAGAFAGLVLGSAFAPVYAYPAPAYVVPPAYAPPPPSYWYFCRSAGAYYPYVPSCPEPWLPVPAR